MKLTELLTEKEIKLIAKHNAAQKLNNFFYMNDDSHKLFKSTYENADRFDFVHISYHVSAELTKSIHRFHGKEVTVMTHQGTPIKGILEHPLTRVYEDRIINNETSFRPVDGQGYTGQDETIAMWVNTGEKYTTHLYLINQIETTDKTIPYTLLDQE